MNAMTGMRTEARGARGTMGDQRGSAVLISLLILGAITALGTTLVMNSMAERLAPSIEYILMRDT